MTIPSANWPKPYLLQIHAEAVKHGWIWIEPISEANAVSLRQRLYRIRRRSDTSTASFIPAEYHLVTIGEWEPGPDGLGRMPATFNMLPDGQALPSLTPRTDLPTPATQAPPPVLLSEADLKMSTGEISSFVEHMKRRVKDND